MNDLSLNTTVMDVTEIKKYLPHRYPFLLVDRVVSLVLGESIIAYKNITGNEAVFNGHFPQAPIFPGVLIVEALAQAAGILGFKTMGKTPEEGSVYLFAGADDVLQSLLIEDGFIGNLIHDCIQIDLTGDIDQQAETAGE